MNKIRITAVLLATATLVAPSQAQRAPARASYYPPSNAWEHRTPEQVGLTAKGVADAVALAKAAESTTTKDLLAAHRNSFAREPFGEATGPFRSPRGGASGLIIRNGYIVGEWGDPDRVDQIFSVTKSFVTTTVGLAFDRKMIASLNDAVHKYVPPVVALRGAPGAGAPLVPVAATAVGSANVNTDQPPPQRTVAFDAFEIFEPFETDHNRKITWDHLLRQTSEWQGTLWGKPDWGDRPSRDSTIDAWKTRARPEPGTVYTYNDVRVNLMALASLMVWRRPLPQVLREHVMDPIGASGTWRWYGYDNSWVVLDGQLVQSVAGGAHWGGGLVINSKDMARFGLLTLRRGQWAGKQILSEEWLRMATTPGVNAEYGFANFFLNTGRKSAQGDSIVRALPNAPATAFWHLGNGNNIIYVDRENDIVIVARWMNNTRTLDAMVKALRG
jgi:CubicO group peptidase (beta-lactamase class C family)